MTYLIILGLALAAFSCVNCQNEMLRIGPPPPFQEECVHGTYPPKGRPEVGKYTINLDLPPQSRWDELGSDKGPQIKHLIDTLIEFLQQFGKPGNILIDFINSDVGYLVDTLPAPFADEIKGLANSTGIPLGQMVTYNIFYEIFSMCTSLIAEDPTGKLYHARNLDFGLFMGWNPTNHSWKLTDALRPIIVQLDWQKGGQTVFKSVNFAGYIGILTAVKPKLFTITMNERFSLDGGFVGILKWLFGTRDMQWMGFLTRNVMEYSTSYTDARKQLADTTLLAPAYFIVGGNQSGEGCIITREGTQVLDVWNLGTKNSSWYLIETNYDNWKNPPFFDDRRTPAHNCMDKMTQQNVGIPGIYDVLSSRPVLNKLTTYSALMQVDSGHLETHIQFCPDPCSPW